MKIEYHDTLPSTIQYCELLDLSQVEEFTFVVARQQTAGIGQRGNHWEAAPGQNLSFSLILHPTFLPIADQFQLTKALSLGITDWLQRLLPQHCVSIKWPNDIYVGLEKICGTLTLAKISGSTFASSNSGVGVNINQTTFSDWIPNPTSLSLLTGQTYDLDALMDLLAQALQVRYEQLRADIHAPDAEYFSLLLNRGIPARYLYRGKEITATIDGVSHYGHLLLHTPEGQQLVCQLKEIKSLL